MHLPMAAQLINWSKLTLLQGSIKGDGLGLLAWWAAVEGEEEEQGEGDGEGEEEQEQ